MVISIYKSKAINYSIKIRIFSKHLEKTVTPILENKPGSPDDYMPLDLKEWDTVALGINRRELKAMFNQRKSSLAD